MFQKAVKILVIDDEEDFIFLSDLFLIIFILIDSASSAMQAPVLWRNIDKTKSSKQEPEQKKQQLNVS